MVALFLFTLNAISTRLQTEQGSFNQISRMGGNTRVHSAVRVPMVRVRILYRDKQGY